MNRNRNIFIAASLASLFIASCNTTSSSQRGETVYLDSIGGSGRTGSSGQPVDTVSYWDGDNIDGPASIKLVLSEQKAYFRKGGQLVGISQISSGKKGYDSPTGSFSILQKNANHRSNLYGSMVDSAGNVINDDFDTRKDKLLPGTHFEGAPMPNFMRITNGGVGMHAGFLPGFAASHGCLRMPEWMSKKFFENVSLGTPVLVLP
jgi:hypothetical protein